MLGLHSRQAVNKPIREGTLRRNSAQQGINAVAEGRAYDGFKGLELSSGDRVAEMWKDHAAKRKHDGGHDTNA